MTQSAALFLKDERFKTVLKVTPKAIRASRRDEQSDQPFMHIRSKYAYTMPSLGNLGKLFECPFKPKRVRE